MSCFQVLDTNRLDEAAAKTYSSQNADYPVTNAYDLSRRRKTWRTAGAFKVVSGENTIVFRESVGVDLTATVAAGQYSSDSAFRTAVKAALDAAGDSTYTVSRDTTTNKIKITSNGSGGGGILQLMWTDADSADMADMLGYSTAADDTGVAPATGYIADLLKIHSEEWLLWDFGFPMNPTALVCVSDRNAPLKISPSATIKLQGSNTNAWDSPAEEFTITYRDYLIGYLNSDGIAQNDVNGYRYWRLSIIDADNNYGYLELGAIYLGEMTDITRGCPEFPLETPYFDNTEVFFSQAGQSVVSRRPQSQRFQLSWAKLDNASMEALERVWNGVGLHTSFFVAMDEDSAFSTDGVTWTRLVKFDSAPIARLVTPGNWSYQWTLREEL